MLIFSRPTLSDLYNPRLDARQQRRVTWINAQFTYLAGQYNKSRVACKKQFFYAKNVDPQEMVHICPGSNGRCAIDDVT